MKVEILPLAALYTFSYGYGQSAEQHLKRGNAKPDIEDYRGDIVALSQANDVKPDDADPYHSRGLVKLHLGRKNSGCLDLSKAGELGHDEAYDAIKENCN